MDQSNMKHNDDLFTNLNDNHEFKNKQDRYDIYVNKDYVGQKMMFAQNEEIYDVEDFLKEQGVNDFQTELDGDHFHFQTDNDAESQAMKEVLGVYLQSR